VPLSPLRATDPARVGPHRLLARLGEGGMGTVFLGMTPDERAVAVKVLRDRPLALESTEARQRFRHELSALQRVRGPHLVEVLHADMEAENPFLVTRFVPGVRLDELVERQGARTGPALHALARGLADALATLHEAGLVHRDVTPANVLVLDDAPHLIDLGLALAADVTALTRSGLVIGTPGYLAPEQVTGRPVTSAADVHAWGATVAFAATGRPPYGTGRAEAVLYRIVHESPDLAGLPDPLAGLVRAAMDPDPARRPDATELLAALGDGPVAQAVTTRLPRHAEAGRTAARALVPAGTPAPWPADDTRWHDDGWHDETRSYDETDAYDETPWYDEPPLLPWEDPSGTVPDAQRSPARTAQLWVTGASALSLVAAGSLVAPVLSAAAVLVLLVALRGSGRSGARRALRRERRGTRRRDPVLAAVEAPWDLLVGALSTLAALPAMLVVAAVPAGVVWWLAPTVDGLEPPELTATAGTVVALLVALAQRASRPSRLLLRRALFAATPGPAAAVALVLALGAAAVLLLAAAEGSAPTWWPLPSAFPSAP
jgi:serine/threonine protein kinase